MFPIFANRTAAGKELAHFLESLRGRGDVLILALPRGGVPVAYEIAKSLALPLDVFLVRKLGVPGHEELAMGAIASGGVRVFNREILHQFQISEQIIERVASKEEKELERRNRLYRGDAPLPQLKGRIVVVVDDGVATGATMKVAVLALRQAGVVHLIVAVPVGAPDSCALLERGEGHADEVICAHKPEPFYGVGQWYQSFPQTTDQEVQDLLARSSQNVKASSKDA